LKTEKFGLEKRGDIIQNMKSLDFPGKHHQYIPLK
jgi:hypothetical protein